ncbi:hypothetical protein QWI18_16365 [Pseudomonas sp. W2Oct36]|uniref:hypothetical protein n=1 Tax=Pseudomonas sp. W2Oct36 TaxID=1215284 RepID=UPI0034E0D325
MNDAVLRHPIPLPPPVVPSAAPEDGLLNISALENPIPVEVQVWEAAEPGYYFQLVLDGAPLGNIRVITEDDRVGDMITVHLSEVLFNHDGFYEMGYMTTSPNTEVSDYSPPITLRVDRTKPGATLLAPLIFPTATLGDQLIGLLPSYAGMAPGDVIQTLLNGVAGPSHKVEADELTLRPVEIAFSREHLQAHAAETVSVEYFVTDRADNVSITSLPTLVSIKL